MSISHKVTCSKCAAVLDIPFGSGPKDVAICDCGKCNWLTRNNFRKCARCDILVPFCAPICGGCGYKRILTRLEAETVHGHVKPDMSYRRSKYPQAKSTLHYTPLDAHVTNLSEAAEMRHDMFHLDDELDYVDDENFPWIY